MPDRTFEIVLLYIVDVSIPRNLDSFSLSMNILASDNRVSDISSSNYK
jgi:hypothetical protein